MQRLDKYLANLWIISRRDAPLACKKGDVLVDLRSEEDRIKVGSDYNSQTNEYNIEKSNTNNKEE